jgi:hypothetical protein
MMVEHECLLFLARCPGDELIQQYL